MPFVGSTHYQKIETCCIAYIFQNLPKESVILVKQNRVFEKQFIVEEEFNSLNSETIHCGRFLQLWLPARRWTINSDIFAFVSLNVFPRILMEVLANTGIAI